MKLKLRDYQVESIAKLWSKLEANKKVCLAAACGSGKSITIDAFIEEYIVKNPTHKILVLTHAQTILRSQFRAECDNIKVNFKYKEITLAKPLTDNIYNKNSVIIAIPQGLRNITDLPHFDLVIIDEGHQFYFAKNKGKSGMVQQIIKKSGAKYQVVLTGTPSPYILRKWPIISICMDKLFPKWLSEVFVELVSSSYMIKFEDYDFQDCEVKLSRADKVFTEKATRVTLDNLLLFLFKRLKLVGKTNSSLAVATMHLPNWLVAFKKLLKTMIACRSQYQARQVKKVLTERGIPCVISISDDEYADDAQRTFKKFKEDKDILVLIVVGRGVLGFNYPELANVIDMTCSTNINRVFQLFSRLVRKAKGIDKLFIKIVPDMCKGMRGSDYFEHFMEGVFAMTQEEWFTKFNGKNFLQLDLMDTRKPRKRKRGNGGGGGQPPKRFKIGQIWGLGVLDFFTKLWHKDDAGNHAYASTSLGQIRERVLGVGYHDSEGNIKEILKWIKDHPIKKAA